MYDQTSKLEAMQNGKTTYREVLLRASFLESKTIEGYSIQFLFLERKKME